LVDDLDIKSGVSGYSGDFGDLIVERYLQNENQLKRILEWMRFETKLRKEERFKLPSEFIRTDIPFEQWNNIPVPIT
jgi:hypothetical protein